MSSISKVIAICACACVFVSTTVFAEDYVAPPTDLSFGGNVELISKEEMEKCVISYNEIMAIEKKANSTKVDETSQKSIDAYNAMIDDYNAKVDAFNAKCEGKASETAEEVTDELNKSKNK